MDEKEEGSRSIGDGDIMIRRMKNRERQRRYRARKRLLEASNNENLCISNQSCVAEKPEPELSYRVENSVWRVYCSREWKKDARRAHSMKRARDVGSAESSIKIKTSEDCDGNSTGFIDKEKQKIRPGRRDWKAEARNKKDGTIVVVEKLNDISKTPEAGKVVLPDLISKLQVSCFRILMSKRLYCTNGCAFYLPPFIFHSFLMSYAHT
ncbi:PREDICTED: uncharacterized protein LOC104814445 [Tarenaya hassleriana]|uniref:uncharacterized protein LOC104814445 n=1 Tax=Tarenaya hassleriana TaxID=28532 RepID=UPI00053C8C72|nr:PREDICTED: uncharacterized protein LOC104814445 [Tarenaya hassleriana]